MMHVTLILCDTLMTATVDKEQNWCGQCTDAMTGESRAFTWTNDQMSAVIALAFNDGWDKIILKHLYEIATPLFEGWPNNIKPIP